MTTLIISDLHLSTSVDQDRLNYLQNLFSEVDQVILNGDFWDVYTTTFQEFLNSEWSTLFPILKQKNTIYIEGNHDHAKDTNEDVTIFCTKHLSEYTLQMGKYTLHIEHGHLKSSYKQPTADWIVEFYRNIGYNKWFRDPLEKVLIATDTDLLHRWHMSTAEKRLIDYASNLPENHFLVTGHTHLPGFFPEKKYINTGYINHSVGYYLLVKPNYLALIKEQYLPERKILSKQELK